MTTGTPTSPEPPFSAESDAAAEVVNVLRDHWPDPVFGCECTPTNEETGEKAVLDVSWEVHVAGLIVTRVFPPVERDTHG